MPSKKIRNSNVELLRIFLMLMVIGVHYNLIGMGSAFLYTQEAGVNVSLAHLLEALCIVCVDTFIIITGYFQSTKKTINKNKVIEILVLMFVLKILLYLLDVIVFNKTFEISTLFSETFYGNWFIIKYLILYMLSPFINKLLNTLNDREYKKLVIIVASLFILLPTILNFLSMFAMVDGWAPITGKAAETGYTIVSFVTLYIIGGYLRKTKFSLKKRYSLAGYIVCALIVFLTWYIIEKTPYAQFSSIPFYYNNIFVVLESVFIFLFFNKLKMTNRKIINTVSSATLSVFIISTTPFFFKIYDILGVKTYCTTHFLIPHFMFTCVTIFIMSAAIGLITMFVLNKTIFKLFNKKDNQPKTPKKKNI